VLGDSDVEPNDTFFVTLSNPTNALIVDGVGAGAIDNDDVPPFQSLPVATPAGSDVAVSVPPATVTFDEVTQAGETAITMSAGGPPPPAGFQLGAPPTYIDLSTTAGFTGSATVCINYSGFAFADESLVRLFHFDDPLWTDITTFVDTVADVICGVTTSFSPFAVFEPAEPVGPVLTLPANITTEASGPSGAPVAFVATAIHEIDGPLPVVCDHSSGSTFPLGATTVSCSANDSAGHATTGGFTVMVVDTSAPALILPASITAATPNAAGVVISFSASASDAVDGPVAVTCLPASGSNFPVGTTTVSCTATDSRGNAASGSFTVSLSLSTSDNTAPKVRGLRNYKVAAATPDGTAVSFKVWGSDLEDGILPVVCSHQSGQVFPIGRTVVTCTTTDTAGAIGTGRFVVKVIANKRPKVRGLPDRKVRASSRKGAAVRFRAFGVDPEDGKLPAMYSHPARATRAIYSTPARRISGSHFWRISRAISKGLPSRNCGRNNSTDSGPP
jgi:hypothetical protein